jgi:hypothetical protein
MAGHLFLSRRSHLMVLHAFSRPLAVSALAVLALLGACGRGDRARIQPSTASQMRTIGVNAYLWRASLETIAFMPIAQTDSNGGVIVTDWYTNPQSPSERVKVSVAILDAALRADALQVSANRQVLGAAGWVEAPVRAGTVQRLEEAILTRARELRQAATAAN